MVQEKQAIDIPPDVPLRSETGHVSLISIAKAERGIGYDKIRG